MAKFCFKLYKIAVQFPKIKLAKIAENAEILHGTYFSWWHKQLTAVFFSELRCWKLDEKKFVKDTTFSTFN